MLNKILFNLKNHPEDECYQIKDTVYRNKDLYRYVCNIYGYLLKNCKRQDRIVVYGHKEIYMLASFLACSFAGMTYIPVDVSFPDLRRESIIKQVNPRLIIDDGIKGIMDNPVYEDIFDIRMQDGDIYYIIFTSGSTGEPKGIRITYSNLKSCMNWLTDMCRINRDVVLNQAIFSFDLSVADIYLPLLTRSKHYIIERETQKDFGLLFKELKNSNAGIAVMTPSYADLLLLDKSFCSELMPSLKTILFCGEKLSEKTAQNLFERFKGIRIINSYGPSECTFAVTSTDVMPGEEISIGTPKPDVDIHILDGELKEVKDGETGELLIVGESVGKGYINRNLNQNIFIIYGGRNAYLTGDLAYRKNGKIFYAGRKDKQVKFKGYRIELLEIEKVLNSPDYVERAVVATSKNKSGKISRITAFVKLKDGSNATAQQIKQYAEKYLPAYMVPAVKTVEEIPLNENGKTNEKALSGG